MNKSTQLIIGLGIVSTATLIGSPAQAEVNILDKKAQTEPTIIGITPGQTTVIHFQNDEKISYLVLSDKSRIVYSLNAPTESGAAKSIFLRNIEELKFPGEINSSNPNLFVVSVDAKGRQKQYEFVIDSQKEQERDINIIPAKIKKILPGIKTELGEASLEDIRMGLKYRLARGDFSASDPLALNTAEALAISLNEDRSLIKVARELQIPLSLLSELGRTGLAQKTKYRLENRQQTTTSLRETRQLLMEDNNSDNEIETYLGKATLKDIELGILVMQKKGLISQEKTSALSKVIDETRQDNNTLQSVSKEHNIDNALLSEAGRLGLAFEARQRIFGSNEFNY
jgi:hypothetical protein